MINKPKPPAPRRGAPQHRQQQQQQRPPQHTQQQQQQAPLPPQPPQNTTDLKGLLSQYGNILTPQNRSFITELIDKLEQGGDKQGLMDLAARMQQASQQQK